MNLEGKKAIVTGASRGLGRAIATGLAREGADIVCIARSLDALKDTAAEIQSAGREAYTYAVDVSDEEAVSGAVADIHEQTGTIDILVNNAGITRDGLLARMSADDWDAVIDTNLKGAFHWTKPVTRIMAKQRAGRLVHISSVIGLMGNAGQANYAASKAGLIGFSKSVAKEFAARGITSNVICPGFIETDMTNDLSETVRESIMQRIPLKRFGKPEDVASVVSFLCGPGAAYITGQVLTVDGGMVI